jgi:hypothetical protein
MSHWFGPFKFHFWAAKMLERRPSRLVLLACAGFKEPRSHADSPSQTLTYLEEQFPLKANAPSLVFLFDFNKERRAAHAHTAPEWPRLPFMRELRATATNEHATATPYHNPLFSFLICNRQSSACASHLRHVSPLVFSVCGCGLAVLSCRARRPPWPTTDCPCLRT